MKARELYQLIKKTLEISNDFNQEKCLMRFSYMVNAEDAEFDYDFELPNPGYDRDGAPIGGKQASSTITFDIEDFEAVAEIFGLKKENSTLVLQLDTSWNKNTKFMKFSDFILELQKMPQELDVKVSFDGKTPEEISIDEANFVRDNLYTLKERFESCFCIVSFDSREAGPNEIQQYAEQNEEQMYDLALQAYENAEDAYYELQADVARDEWED